jgi:PKHD-type hydroxylase
MTNSNTPADKKTQTPNSSWVFDVDHTNQWAYWDNAFTTEECLKIIEIGESRLLQKGIAHKDNGENRDCEISWLYSVDDMDWVFRRATDIITNLNDRFFKFDIFGMVEGFQFTKYSAPGQHYKQHVDSLMNGPVRKLSFTLQLSDPADYTGGELELITGSTPNVMSKEQGHVALFPSYMLHQVKPVTTGTRYSLVSWITGRPFK